MKSYNTYLPDRWQVVKVHGSAVLTPSFRVLAGWGGSFTTGESWKLSSGIEKVIETEYTYEFKNASGSIYRCSKTSMGMMMIMAGVLQSLNDEARGVEVEPCTVDDVKQGLVEDGDAG